MRPQAIGGAAAAVVLVAFGAGWLGAEAPGGPDAPDAAPRVDRPTAAGTPAAIAELAVLIADDHPPAPESVATGPVETNEGDPVYVEPPSAAPVSPPPPPPPPPDVAVTFRRQLVAVSADPDGGLSAVMASAGGRRRLRVGDAFEGGWVIEALSREAAVLRNGSGRRRIPFFGGAVTDERSDD